MDSLLEQLAGYATSLRYDQIPPETVERAKALIVDTIGCALGGYDSESGRIARSMADVGGGKLRATVIGSGAQTSPDLAAFANGVAIRYLDFNDWGGGGHRSDLLAPVLAVAEASGRDGKDVILALVLAYEVMGRISEKEALIPPEYGGIWDHPTLGVMAAALASSRLLGLSSWQAAHALSLAITSNMALIQVRHGLVSMWKGVAAPNASRNGVFAALLASHGMEGSMEIFSGQAGFFKATTRPFELGPLGGQGGPFSIMDSNIKQFPCGSIAQSAMEAALKLRARLPGPQAIKTVRLQTFEHGLAVMADSPVKWRPPNRETADHSFPYALAIAFLYGELQVRHFADEYLHSPEVAAMMDKIQVEVGEECKRLQPDRLAILEVETVDGRHLTERSMHYRGHSKNFMDRAEIEAKFRRQWEGLLPPQGANGFLERLWNLEELKNIGGLLALTRVPKPAPA